MQAKATPLLCCDSHIFFPPPTILCQCCQALNTFKKEKGEKRTVTALHLSHGSLARCRKLSHLVENTLHNHTRRPQKWHHSFTCFTFHWQQAATRKKKKHTMTGATAYKATKGLAMFLFQHEQRHVRWLRISNQSRHTYSSCVHMYIYIQDVPRNTKQASKNNILREGRQDFLLTMPCQA